MQKRGLFSTVCQSQSRETKKKYLVMQMDFFAQSSCQQICSAMQQKLPRELRDEIYAYVHGCKTIYVVPSTRYGAPPRFLENVDYLVKNQHRMAAFFEHPSFLSTCRSKDPTAVYYFNEKYVGKATQQEIVQSWFNKNMFQFGDSRAIYHLLHLPWPQWGLRPVDYIRRVELSVYDPYDEHDPIGETRPINCSTVLEEFMNVASLHGMSIEITSRMSPREQEEHRCKVFETPGFKMMMRRIHEASKKGHQCCMVHLKTHAGIRFTVPDAQNADWDDWYEAVKRNLQKA